MFIRSTALLVALGSALTLSLGANVAVVANSQQTKMADCNKQATGKKGDERKAFMSSCLSNKG